MMGGFAWGAIIALSALTIAAVWRWVRDTGELVAPLPIGLVTIAVYIIPRAIYLLAFHRAPLTSAGLTEVKQLAVVTATVSASLIAAVGFLLGHRARRAICFGTQLEIDLPKSDPNRVIWVGGAAAFVGGLVLAYLLSQLGSITYAMGHQDETNAALQGKQALLYQLARLVVVAVILLLIDPVTGRSRWWVWAFAGASILALLPFGSRALILLAGVSPVVLYHLTVRRIRVRWLGLGTVVLGTGLFALGFVRLLSFQRLEQTTNTFARQPLTLVHFTFNAAGELKIFDATSIVVRDVPKVTPYNYGVTFARVPWMIIPRRLWRDKPVTSGHMIVRRYLPNLRTAYPPMAIGEFFAAAGWLGVLVGFFALGWTSRAAWEWYQRHRGTGNASIYLLYCFFVFDFIRVGDPSRTFWFFAIGSAMTVLLFVAAGPLRVSSLLSRAAP